MIQKKENRACRGLALALALAAALPLAAGTDCWTYVPGSPAGTISWTDASGFENVVKGVVLDGVGVLIKASNNRNSPTIKNLDFSLPVRDANGVDLAWSPDVFKGDGDNNVVGYSSYLTNIVLPSACTSLGRYCFKGNSALERVRLNDGLVSIAPEAFYECVALKTVENFFPASLETIGANAFQKCRALSGNIVASSSLKSIGSRAFHSCTALQGFDGSASALDKIDDFVFYQCSSLESAAVPSSVTNIGKGAFFDGTSLRSFTPLLPPGLAAFGDDEYAPFRNCPLEGHLVWPRLLERIPLRAFRGSRIETFTAAKNGLRSIGQYAFYYNTMLTNIVLSATLESLTGGWIENAGPSSAQLHIWFRNLPSSIPSSMWSGTTTQKITAHLPWSQRDAWRAWVASAPEGHTFTFGGQTGKLPEKLNDVGTWKSTATQNVTWWKESDPLVVTIR